MFLSAGISRNRLGASLFSLSQEAVPQFCTSIRETFLPICRCFFWQPQVCFRISKAARATCRVSCEKMAHVLRSKPIDRLVDHQSRLLVDKLANGFPTRTPDEWSTWGIKAAVRCNSGSAVLKLLELINISFATTTPYRAAVSKRLHDARVQCFQGDNWECVPRMF